MNPLSCVFYKYLHGVESGASSEKTMLKSESVTSNRKGSRFPQVCVMSKKMLMPLMCLVLLVATLNKLPLLRVRRTPGICWKTGLKPREELQTDNSVLFKELTQESLEYEPPSLPTKFLIEESDFCRRNPNLNVIVYVHSAINETAKRQMTRETWAMAGTWDNRLKVGVVFMVGKTKSEEEENILLEESQHYRDIVQGSYEDSYHMLSYKAMASLVWVDRHCSHVPWTLHADDDVLIDLFLLEDFLKSDADKGRFLCHTWEGAEVRRHGKWLVRENEYPNSEYPPYCSGAIWILPTRLIGQLLDATAHVPFLWVDDVYVTGVLARTAGIGHSKQLDECIFKDTIEDGDIGEVIAWVHLQDRKSWWKKIVAHYGHIL